ncbi:uncharacterized protein I303_103625 [Kwoniella dejecticola CBS 10117]|uniref:Fe2OG dioxygenase domain-containing protein n=1 Tax=Kwoniella dejecticola CBS 10117 TaxID=1296121 RepID=A0A1A6A798_9TREE|nr:uncharacterized protein I303_03647 [Kwoniella dejecticola CBS 10117]OBR85932.1 hypothetical protein I303_03647 [Kwoniella dejecticola CBS 10117]
MKRASGSSTALESPRASKRQASLAGFLKPKTKVTNGASSAAKRCNSDDGRGKEEKPIVIDVDEVDSEGGNEDEDIKTTSTNKADKGKGKAEDVNSEIEPIVESQAQSQLVDHNEKNGEAGVDSKNGKSADEDLDLDLNLDNAWPPPNHPYHPPPNPTYNHPIPIGPIPSELQPIHFNTKPKIINNPITELDLVYYKRFIDPKLSSKALMNYLLNNLPWYRVKYMVRGMHINTPRYTTVFGKDSTPTPWSGYQKCSPRAIPEVLQRLMRKVEQITGSQFNFCLVNYYASGDDSISYHSDSESFLGLNPTIASLTLGQSRDFLLRHVNYKNHPKTGKEVKVEKFILEDGDMVVMQGRTQHEWQHSIPKRKNLGGGRINITFRKGIVKYATENYYNYNVGKGNLHRWDGKRKQMVESLPSDGGVK